MRLENYRITSLAIINERGTMNNQNIKLSYQYGLGNNNFPKCTVEATAVLSLVEEENQDDKTFFVKMSMAGAFSCESQDKELLRKQGAKELLPLLRSHIATAMASIGMDPITIPIHRIADFNDL